MTESFLESLQAQLHTLNEPQQRALQQALTLGLPSIKNEAWRDTELRFFTNTALALQDPQAHNTSVATPYLKNAGHTLIFINGVFQPFLSQYDQGAIVLSQVPVSHLPKPLYTDFFDGLNEAFAKEATLIQVVKTLPEPIYVFSISTLQRHQTTFVRFHVHFSKQVKATWVESHLNVSPMNSATHALITYEAESNSVVDLGIQHDVKLGGQLHHSDARLHSHAKMNAFLCDVSGQEIRHAFTGQLADEHATLQCKSLNVLTNRQHLSLLIDVQHAKPNTSSTQMVRNLVFDSAKSAFTGSIKVHPKASQTRAQMLNKNVLFSAQAQSLSRPLLEIDTDAVECSHGSSTGFLDEAALFYLKSRGIEDKEAKTLLARAFAEELLQEIEAPAIRKQSDKVIQTLIEHFKPHMSVEKEVAV